MIVIGNAKILSKQPLWHKLIKDYQDMSLLVEGPLTNLRRSDMHLSKPAKLINKFNPGASYMSRSMVSAKEAMMSTPLYDYSTRSGGLDGYTGVGGFHEDYYHSHDPMGYIGHERRAQSTAANMHIPLSMFVQPTPQQGYYRPQGGAMGGAGGEHSFLFHQSMMNSQASQDGTASQPLTQSQLSMSQPSQPLSQTELTQDLFTYDELKSQPDTSLSQDSAYHPEGSQPPQRPLLDYSHPAYGFY